MNTVVRKLETELIDQEYLEEASEFLRENGTVAFPTETVYGLGANAMEEVAVKKIYEAKGRPSDNPLIVHIGHVEQVAHLVNEIPANGKKLMDAFWPGPLTIIMKKSDAVPDHVTAGLDSVAIRMPAHPIALALLRESELPLAAPSANTSGKPSPTIAKHVVEDLKGRVNMILDGGNCDIGLESTVIDVSEGKAMILRPGAVTVGMCEDVLGKGHISVDPALLKKEEEIKIKPKSPGMKYTHYSPEAEVYIAEGEQSEIIEKIRYAKKKFEEQGKIVGIMATDQTIGWYSGSVINVGDRKNPKEIGARLFSALRDFDTMGVDIVLAEEINGNNLEVAIMNRLTKAAGYKFIQP